MAVSNLRQRGRSLPCGPSGAILCRLWTRDGWWKGMGNYHRRPRSVVTGLGSCCVSPWGAAREPEEWVGRGLHPIYQTTSGQRQEEAMLCVPPPLFSTTQSEANMGIPRNILLHLAPTSSLPRELACILVGERRKEPRLCSCCGICSLTTHTRARMG